MAGEPTFTQEQVDALIAEKVGEVDGLKANTKKALDEVKAARAKLSAYEGLDPEEAKGWRQKITDLETQSKAAAAGITNEQLTKIRQETAAEYERKFGPVGQENATLKAELRGMKLDTVVKGMMGKGGARAERIDALFKLTADRFDLTDDGAPMLKASAKELDKYIGEDLRTEYPEFFQPSGSNGGGASKSNGGAGGAVTRIAAPTGGSFGKDFLANVENISKGKVVVE